MLAASSMTTFSLFYHEKIINISWWRKKNKQTTKKQKKKDKKKKKKISADDNLKYFSHFPRKSDLTFQANCKKFQSIFSGKNKKTIISLSSTELAQEVVKVEQGYFRTKYNNLPNVLAYVSAIQLITFSPVPMSGAGTSIPGPRNERK